MDKKHLLEAQRLARADILSAPASFLMATEDRLQEICNGCGAADSWFRPPERIYGTLIVYACIIHDRMYEEGRTIEDKEEADSTFLNNMIRLIERDRSKWYKPTALQLRRAKTYFKGVDYFGGPAFWAGKS